MRTSCFAAALLPAVTLGASTANSTNSSQDDLLTVFQRRIPFIIESYPVSGPDVLDNLVSTINSNGQWPNVDYTSGCPAQRANWPAQNHWINIVNLASAYTNSLPATANFTREDLDSFVGNERVLNIINSGMNFWFDNDYSNPDCTDRGGKNTSSCPCGTPGLWNSNWYSNVILIPRLAGQACILMSNMITTSQRNNCTNMGLRGYNKFYTNATYVTGANIMDMASNGVNVALLEAYSGQLENGTALIEDAYSRVHNEVTVHPQAKIDGIKPDGSFSQHIGLLYTGNYGKDYANLFFSLETCAAGTQWAANASSQAAFRTYILDGSQWMIYRNTKTQVLHWDMSVIGRFITFPVADGQASGSILLNLTQFQQLGNLWHSDGLQNNATRLMGSDSTSNAGRIEGNRMFWSNDYMVHRGREYVTTVKTLSNRTRNSECTNSQNPYSFHLGSGAVFNYLVGNEYEDISAAWDWNLIPGITTDYGVTLLNCEKASWLGKTSFVGGASDGKVGVTAMDYLNPYTRKFRYRKAWFFFENDVQHVSITGVSNSTADVYSVLDQKRVSGDVYVDGQVAKSGNYSNATSLWHAGIGYTFDAPSESNGLKQLSFNIANPTGNWSAIGTSTQPPTTVNLFKGWLHHDKEKIDKGISYTVYPSTRNAHAFREKASSRQITTIRNDVNVSASADLENGTLMSVFWLQGGSISIPGQNFTLTSSVGAVVIFDMRQGALTVADPTQALQFAEITITGKHSHSEKCMGVNGTTTARIALPTGALAGSSVSQQLC